MTNPQNYYFYPGVLLGNTNAWQSPESLQILAPLQPLVVVGAMELGGACPGMRRVRRKERSGFRAQHISGVKPTQVCRGACPIFAVRTAYQMPALT